MATVVSDIVAAIADEVAAHLVHAAVPPHGSNNSNNNGSNSSNNRSNNRVGDRLLWSACRVGVGSSSNSSNTSRLYKPEAPVIEGGPGTYPEPPLSAAAAVGAAAEGCCPAAPASAPAAAAAAAATAATAATTTTEPTWDPAGPLLGGRSHGLYRVGPFAAEATAAACDEVRAGVKVRKFAKMPFLTWEARCKTPAGGDAGWLLLGLEPSAKASKPSGDDEDVPAEAGKDKDKPSDANLLLEVVKVLAEARGRTLQL